MSLQEKLCFKGDEKKAIDIHWLAAKCNKQTNEKTSKCKKRRRRKEKQLICFGEHPSATESQLPDQVGTSKYKVQAMHTLCQKEEATKQADN